MTCRDRLILAKEQELCPMLIAAFQAGLVVGAEALFLLDTGKMQFTLSSILSHSIRNALEHRNLLDILRDSGMLKIIDLYKKKIHLLSRHPYSSRLSFNLCLDKKAKFFVNFQATPLDLQREVQIRYLVCSLKFASREEANILLIDREEQKMWRHYPPDHSFVEESELALSTNELEMIRLSRMGNTERGISDIMCCSLDTIKWYRRKAFEKLSVSNIGEAIAFCEVHHLI